jgi:Family of unknown function (DUF5757)
MAILNINNTDIPVYPEDDDSSLKERIAARLGTTPFMLWIHGAAGTVPYHGEYDAEDVYATARKQSFSDFNAMLEHYSEWLSQDRLADHTALSSDSRYVAIIRAYVENMYRNKVSPRQIAAALSRMSTKDVEDYIANIQVKRNEHNENVRETIRLAREAENNIKAASKRGNPSAVTVEGTKSMHELHMNRYVPIQAIFDSISVVREGEGVRFARLGRFIKFHQASKPPSASLVHVPDEDEPDLERCSLVIGVTLPADVAADTYTTFRLQYVTKERSDGRSTALVVDFAYRHGEPDPLQALQAYVPLLKQECTSSSRLRMTVVATMVVPKFRFITEYLNHVIFLGEVSANFVLDERHNSSRGRVQMMHLPTRTKISVGMEKLNDQTGEFTRVRFYDVAQVDTLNEISQEVYRVLRSYAASEARLIEMYARYLPPDVDAPRHRVLRDTARSKVQREAVRSYLEQAERMPELFAPYYTRSCSRARLPKILNSRSEVGDDQAVHIFPKERVDNTDPAYMTCPNPDFPHFGLMDNTLKNNDQFEYIPCCYAKNTDMQSSMREYYSDAEKTGRNFQSLYTTPRILPYKSYGTLPNGIAMMFNVLGDAPMDRVRFPLVPEFTSSSSIKTNENGVPIKLRAIRCGVKRGPNSFLESVMRAIHIQQFAVSDNPSGSTYESPSYSEETLQMERLRLVRAAQEGVVVQNVGAQETWDIEPELVTAWLNDPTKYLEPRRFVRLLEFVYKVNIYLFEKNARRVSSVTPDTNADGTTTVKLTFSENNQTPNGALVVPEHCPDGPYFHCKRQLPENEAHRNIFVFVHQGSDVDRSNLVPHVEYVLTDNMYNAGVVAYRMFTRLTMSSANINAVDYDELVTREELMGNVRIDRQTLDRGGRCVAINTRILSEPIPPLPMKIRPRSRFDTDSSEVHPVNTLEGRRVLQRMARVLVGLMVKLRLDNSRSPVALVVDAASFDWNTGAAMLAFRDARSLWRLEDVKSIFVSKGGSVIVDSVDTKLRLEALTSSVIANMTAEDRAAIRASDHISGFFGDIDDFTTRPGQMTALVRMVNTMVNTVRDRVVMYNTPAPVPDRAEALMINDDREGVIELEFKAVHGRAAMMKLMDMGMALHMAPHEIPTYVWDGTTWRALSMRGHLSIKYVLVYGVGNKTVFLISLKNDSDVVDAIVRNF